MTQVRTNLGVTEERAALLRSEPFGPISATNVQAALSQIAKALLSITPNTITSAASPYTVQATDAFLFIDTTGGPVVINLPSGPGRSGVGLLVKDITGHCATNNCTINAANPDTIDGMASVVIATNFFGYNLIPTPSGWGISP